MLSHRTPGEQGGSNEPVLRSAGGSIMNTLQYKMYSIKVYTVHHCTLYTTVHCTPLYTVHHCTQQGLFQASTLLGGYIILDIPGVTTVTCTVHCTVWLYTCLLSTLPYTPLSCPLHHICEPNTITVHHVNKLSPAVQYVWFGWHWGLEKSLTPNTNSCQTPNCPSPCRPLYHNWTVGQ